MVECFEKETARANRWVVNVVLLVWFEYLDDDTLNFAWCVELATFLPSVGRELFDEIFIRITKDIGVNVGITKVVLRKMIDEALGCFVWKTVFVCKIKIIKNPVELWTVRVSEFFKNFIKLLSNILRLLLNDRPATLLRDLKAVVVIGTRDCFVFELI